ncbi:MAG: heparinase II/III domain-containing protein [Rhodothermales bacterium]
MKRRELLQLGGHALLFTALPRLPVSKHSGGPTKLRLFFQPEDVPDVRASAETPLLRPVFEAWNAESLDMTREAVDAVVASGDFLGDLYRALEAMTRTSVLHLVAPSAGRERMLLYGVEALAGLPRWDYMLDGDKPLGLMRASMATERLLFAREVLGDDLPATLEEKLLDAVAEKGCAPCYRTVYGMDHPADVQGWRFDAQHEATLTYNLSRWPEILGASNLRAVPTMGLGLGALAVQGRDEQADVWLETAIASARRFLGFFEGDGSYLEGLSYVDYALRTLFTFLGAHKRLEGTVDWSAEANFEGIAQFILVMQAGRQPEGVPDIVNFSDARRTVHPCVPSWIAEHTGSGLAQYAAEHASEPGYYLDFLWYRAGRPATPPPERLKNVRLDLDWIVCRSGWEAEDALLAFRSGGPANHEHADRNSFFFKAFGERLLTDPFGASYDVQQPGWLLRLTQAHNAVLIDGAGHGYHDGTEGTNESEAAARIVRYEDDGDRVWWCSDATQAYRLAHPDVRVVRRTVFFAKPDVVVLLDEVRKTATPSTVALRFFPDNRDGVAKLETGKDASFVIRRPGARLYGWTQARGDLAFATDQLDLPADLGAFPYVQVTEAAATDHEIMTVLAAQQAGEEALPHVAMQAEAEGWQLEIGGLAVHIDTSGDVPDVAWSRMPASEQG